MTVEELAYIQIEPNNGGIVLNVSSGGLSFQSVDPVEANEPVHFCLSEHKRLLDACGELIWTDEVRKCGGLRFTMLSSEARGQICRWLNHAVGHDENEASTSVFSVGKDKASIPAAPLLLEENKASLPVVPLLLEEGSAASSSAFSVEKDNDLLLALPFLSEENKSSTHEGSVGEDKVSTPVAPFLAEERSAVPPSIFSAVKNNASALVLPRFPAENESSSSKAPLAKEKVSAKKSSLLGVLSPLRTRQSRRKADSVDASAVAVAPPKVASMNGSGFSVGFATGLLISAVGSLIFLFCYAHRLELGDSLVHLGERLGAHSEVQTQKALPALQVAAPAEADIPQQVVLPARAQPLPVTPEVSRKLAVEPEVVVKTLQPKPPAAMTVLPGGTRVTQDFPLADRRSIASAPPAVSWGASQFPKSIVDEVRTVPQPVLASAARPRGFEEATGSTLQMFFDLGKFKDELLAHNVSDRVARLGLPTTVLTRKFLWKTSYQVLVGPYSNEVEEIRVQKDLLSHGYKPRAFERGSRGFLFLSRLSLNESRLPVGDLLTVSWESYVCDAKVQFAQDGHVIATAHGRWMKRPRKYSQDEYVYVTRGDGSKTLLEIHFSGLNRTLVFGNSS